MKPSPGRILHYNIPGIGWRPMLVTKVIGPTEATDGSTNPICVNGWAKLDPDDVNWGVAGPTFSADGEGYVGTEFPVTSAFEGEGGNNWRWPPRV